MKKKMHKTRKQTREKLERGSLACKLYQVITHFFPQLIPMLKEVTDSRNQSYITYDNQVILMVRILSAIFYISSMRKTSEELNNSVAIENIGVLCQKEKLEEIPHWSTINNFLEKVAPEELECIMPNLVKHLLRMRSFEGSRIRGKYWQILIDGVELHNGKKRLSDHCLTRTHKNADGSVSYVEYYYGVLEAKLVINDSIVLSIGTEFIENEGIEVKKQDCELKACYRLMDNLKAKFPRLPMCLTVDSLYAGEPFFRKCKEKGWHYIVRFKEKKIPYITSEYEALIKKESNLIAGRTSDGISWSCNHVNGIEYNGIQVNMVRLEQSDKKYPFTFLTDLPIKKTNQVEIVMYGRRRWKIENQGFDIQKNHGYNLEHLYSQDDTGYKNHYYLIQIGHAIAQMFENWGKLWENMKVSLQQKHERVLQAWKSERLEEHLDELKDRIQIRIY